MKRTILYMMVQIYMIPRLAYYNQSELRSCASPIFLSPGSQPKLQFSKWFRLNLMSCIIEIASHGQSTELFTVDGIEIQFV